MKRLALLALLTLAGGTLCAQTTLDACQQQAQDNYPLIKQYGLIARATEYSVSNARRAWIPQVSLSAQATYQSAVATFPEQMRSAFEGMGVDFKGLPKDQYRVAAELNQTIWDGGASRADRLSAQAAGAADQAGVGVDVYAVRERVNNLYFGILLLDAQARQNDLLQALLRSNIEQVGAYLANGVAMQSDVDAVQAELLTAQQNRTGIEASREAYRAMLSLLTGHALGTLQEPEQVRADAGEIRRPELLYMDKQSDRLGAQALAVRASTRPRIGAFAQGYYGIPGYDMFQDMIQSKWSWNWMVGVRMQWNFGGFYTKRNNLSKIAASRQQIDVQRETFLFNTSLQTTEQRRAIARMREVMAQDERIIALRESVRRAYEAKLANGVIELTDLLREITAENTARITAAAHRIELLKSIYDLKYTTNN